MNKTKICRTAYRYNGRHGIFVQSLFLAYISLLSSVLIHRDHLFIFFRTLSTTLNDSTENAAPKISISLILGHINGLEPSELGLAVLALVCIFLTILAIVGAGSLRLQLLLYYTACKHREGSVEYMNFVTSKATHIFVRTRVSSDSLLEIARPVADVIVKLCRSRIFLYYLHDHKRFIFNEKTKSFEPVEHLDKVDLARVLEWQGLTSKSHGFDASFGLERHLEVCVERYGPNDYEIPSCDFWKMLGDAMLAPFFIFQLASTLVWMLDSYWYYSFLCIVSIFAIEIQMVKKQISEYDRINSMRIPPADISVLRDNKWTTVSSCNVYPGDIIALASVGGPVPTIVAADVLILAGEVVVDESILTGESVPLYKSSIEVDKSAGSAVLDSGGLRRFTLFAGTNLLHAKSEDGNYIEGDTSCSSRFKVLRNSKLPKDSCVCLVLRTGFETFQGRLINSILHVGDKVSASTVEGWCFLGLLLCFAIFSCRLVVINVARASIKKLVTTCLHIVTSVIPPEFPVVMSTAVTIALVHLHSKGITCTEPFRVPYAGKLDVVAFDKTGTLTEDRMQVLGVVDETCTATQIFSQQLLLPVTSALVAGGCHSLVRLKGSVVGDPMEKATFAYFGWQLQTSEQIVNKEHTRMYDSSGREAKMGIQILKRWPFSSELGRMTTVVRVSGRAVSWAACNPQGANFDVCYDGEIMVLCKGAPEKIRKLLAVVPECFDSLQNRLAIGGSRVLALASRRLGRDFKGQSIDASQTSKLAFTVDRTVVECELEFCGFLVLESPIKSSALACMRQLDGHKLVMITGDNVLTACHVAKAVEICDRRNPTTVQKFKSLPFAVLSVSGKEYVWRLLGGQKIDTTDHFPQDLSIVPSSYRCCLTGPVLEALLAQYGSLEPGVVEQLICCCTVFARMSPQQKKMIMSTFRKQGLITAMCGDGTNDMAALRAADVGVSIINTGSKSKRDRLENLHPGARHLRRTGNHISNADSLEGIRNALESEAPAVKLGEASIASPFTYRKSDLDCVPLLVGSGRCTVVNVVMLYKLMGINSLITSLGMSILALDGVNFSDAQTTLYSLLYTCLVLALSRSKPSRELRPCKPAASVFCPQHITSLVFQMALHGKVLLYIWGLGKQLRDLSYIPDLDAEFEPNIVNTLVYYACYAINMASIVANYQGYPHMQPLIRNKQVLYLLMGSTLFLLVTLGDLIQPLNDFFSLVQIPNNRLRAEVLLVILIDVLGSLAIGRGMKWIATKFEARTKTSEKTSKNVTGKQTNSTK